MKCFFDNQMSPKLPRAISELEGKNGITIVHLKDKFEQNIPDTEWMQNLAKEGDWFVITKDTKIRERAYEIEIWKQSNLPIVFLPSDPWMKYGIWETAWRLVKYWSNLKDIMANNKNNDSFVLNAKGEARKL